MPHRALAASGPHAAPNSPGVLGTAGAGVASAGLGVGVGDADGVGVLVADDDGEVAAATADSSSTDTHASRSDEPRQADSWQVEDVRIALDGLATECERRGDGVYEHGWVLGVATDLDETEKSLAGKSFILSFMQGAGRKHLLVGNPSH